MGAARGVRTLAFSHNDTTDGSAPYLWLQSEVAMHRGPVQKRESTPGGSHMVHIFICFKTVFPLLNVGLADSLALVLWATQKTSSVSVLVSSRTR